jgi:hypothetical protein
MVLKCNGVAIHLVIPAPVIASHAKSMAWQSHIIPAHVCHSRQVKFALVEAKRESIIRCVDPGFVFQQQIAVVRNDINFSTIKSASIMPSGIIITRKLA